MPQICHSVPCYGYRGVPFVMQLLVADEGRDLLSVFVEYGQEGRTERLRLLPTDGYKCEEHYSLYAVRVPAEHLSGVCFSYRFCVEEACTAIYTFPLKNVEKKSPTGSDLLFPAVLPLGEGEVPCLAVDAPLMRFVTFPQDLAGLAVCAKIGGTWARFPATLNAFGVWECHLPSCEVAKVGKRLSYYVEASGRVYTTLLGSESAPCTIRIVDDAGPVILSVYPAEGEKAVQDPPVLCVEYKDASGVNLTSSALFLDGRNVSENAKWTANGVTFRPQVPLGVGEHILEISLHDKHANRTYRRVAFFVEGEEGAGVPAAKKPMSATRAAGFFANALSVIKSLFSDKD